MQSCWLGVRQGGERGAEGCHAGRLKHCTASPQLLWWQGTGVSSLLSLSLERLYQVSISLLSDPVTLAVEGMPRRHSWRDMGSGLVALKQGGSKAVQVLRECLLQVAFLGNGCDSAQMLG